MPDNDDYLDDEIMETLDTAVDYNQTWVRPPATCSYFRLTLPSGSN